MLEKKILKEYRSVAVVGASPNPERPSHLVFDYLAHHGYHVIPVNPNAREILGHVSYPDLLSIPEKVEVVDIFRSSDKVLPIVEGAIQVGAKVVWMQEGVINKEAVAKAKKAGLLVVMDKCMMKEHKRLMHKED
jgi:predicted CoA-binding protein